MEIKESDNIV